MTETFSKLKNFYLIIGNYKKLSANLILNGEEAKKKVYEVLTFFSNVLDSLVRVVR